MSENPNDASNPQGREREPGQCASDEFLYFLEG